MNNGKKIIRSLLFSLSMTALIYSAQAQDSVFVNWNKVIRTSKTTPTLQVVEMPRLRFPQSFHDSAFKALKDLGADYVRYVPWFPYPRLVVPELKRPTKDSTFWDFTYPDSTMKAFMEATKGHPVVINFSTIPAWMWKTDAPVPYPDDPYQADGDYNQGTQLRDPTGKEAAAYFGRIFSWYTRGGFTDELGKYHKSGHYYKIPYWEVLNEPDLEHDISPQQYTKLYDAIVGELKKISPQTKFIGITVAFNTNPEWFEYFLNHKNHKPGIPLDGISYHHYSGPSAGGQTINQWQYTFFEKGDAFLDRVRYVEAIRKRLSPETITFINEIGTMVDNPTSEYYSLSGAFYAYMFLELSKIGIDVAGESQLVGFPTMYPDVSMMNWENGNPNARYWALKLIRDNLGKGDKLMETQQNGSGFSSQAFLTPRGKKLLLINRMNEEVKITLPTEADGAVSDYIDVSTNEHPPARQELAGRDISLKPFAVAVVSLK